MKAINIVELKNNLSRYLRAVRRGERITVLDRREPVAEIIPPPQGGGSPWERLAQLGRVTLGTQDWTGLQITRLPRSVPIQDLLQDVRENG
jgi:prevent-host-death family protein